MWGLLWLLALCVCSIPGARRGSCAAAAEPDGSTGGEPEAGVPVLLVGDKPVYWSEYFFWLEYLARYYKSAHGIEAIGDWNAKEAGLELRDYFLDTATAYVCNDRAIEDQARQRGIGLTDAETNKIAKARQDGIRIYGSLAEYQRIVASMYGSEEQYEYLTKIDLLSDHLFRALYGAQGEQCGDDCVAAYVADQGLINTRYIFLANHDAAGRAFSPQRRQARMMRLAGMLRQVDAAADRQAAFSALLDKYNEDPAVANRPQGHLFARGAKPAEFERAYRQLTDNGFSGVVTTEDGYYIIERLPMRPDMQADDAGNTLRYWAAYQYLFKRQISQWCKRTAISYGASYGRINLQTMLK